MLVEQGFNKETSDKYVKDIAKELINDLDQATKEYIESETNDEDK